MTYTSSYVQLDGVEFKISDSVNPPPVPFLPPNFKMKDPSAVLAECQFDFTKEMMVLEKISSVREAEQKLAEKEEKRRQMSMRRKTDSEKQKLEMMAQQREAFQQKRKEFLEQRSLKQQQKHQEENETSATDKVSPTSETAATSPTYENVEFPPPVPPRNPFSQVGKDNILTPQPAARKSQDVSSPSGRTNQSQPAVSGQNQIWEDFEDKELDPFTNAELKTIDDLAELQTVLQNAKIGTELPSNGTDFHPPAYDDVKDSKLKSGEEDQPANIATSAALEQPSSNQPHTLPSYNSKDDIMTMRYSPQTSRVTYDNVNIDDINGIAAALASSKSTSSIAEQESVYNFAQDVKPLRPVTAESSQIETKTSKDSQPLYSQVFKRPHTVSPVMSQGRQIDPVPTSSNYLSKPLKVDFEPSNAAGLHGANAGLNQLQPVLPGINNQIPTGFNRPPTMVTTASQPINIQSIGSNPFLPNNQGIPSPVSTGAAVVRSPVGSSSNSSPATTSPVFPRPSRSYSGLETQNSPTSAPKVLPISFESMINTLVMSPTSSLSAGNIPAVTAVSSQSPTVTPSLHKAPVAAPRRPQVAVKPHPNPGRVAPPVPSKNGPYPNLGNAHLLPPYSRPTSSNGLDSGRTAPSSESESSFVHKSKQERDKFAETVNKALKSLPESPKPVIPSKPKTVPQSAPSSSQAVQKSKQTANNHPPLLTRNLSLKSSLIAGLTSKEQELVNNMTAMGFDAAAAVRAMQKYGLDAKEVVDHLIQVQGIAEQGYSTATVQDALEMFKDDNKSVAKYLQHAAQLIDMGFPEEAVRDALNCHKNDQTKALDQLMGQM